MDRGTYSAASGGLVQFRKLEIVNNNLANSNTPGFKREVLVGQEQTFDQTLARLVQGKDPYAKGDHERTPGVVNIEARTDFSPGPIKFTGNPYDLALKNPKDFFVINTPEGEQYTRAGDFTLGADGALVTQDGQPVAGEGGTITVSGTGINISPDGSVRSNTTPLGRIRVVRFDDPNSLQRIGHTRFQLAQGQPAPRVVDGELEPGSLEMSNVSSITSVLDLITTNRAFDMYTRSAKTIDDMNNSAISQVGRKK